MAPTIFRHWFETFLDLPKWRRLGTGMAVLGLVFGVVFVLGVGVGNGFDFSEGPLGRIQRLNSHNAALETQAQSLQQQLSTSNTALTELRTAMAERDAELQKLKQQQIFYAKLIGTDGDRSELGVHSIGLARVHDTNAWNFVVTLVNTAQNGNAARGDLSLVVEGVRAGKLTTVPWASLAGGHGGDGLAFAFKFFQQVPGTMALPKDFVPNRVVITLTPKRGREVVRAISWADALAGQPPAAPASAGLAPAATGKP